MQPTEDLTYEQFIKQPNWENVLYYNYHTGRSPLTIPDPAINIIDNDTDRFAKAGSPTIYLNKLPEPICGHLARVLILRIKNPWYAYMYAHDVIQGRWLEAEETIRQSSSNAYWYARDVIKGRWPEAEGTIKQDPMYAYLYAMDVIKGRWPEAEETIRQNLSRVCYYSKYAPDLMSIIDFV